MPRDLGLGELIAWVNRQCPAMKIVAPIVKTLACEDVGVGAMADRTAVVDLVTDIGRRLICVRDTDKP